MRAGPTQEEIRRQNLGALLRHVHVRGPISRADLTVRMGLNRSTIGALTADLVEAGLVREELPSDHGRAGRPSLVVRPESVRVFVLALSVGADHLSAARVGLGGVALDRADVPRARGALRAVDVDSLATLAGRMLRGTPPGAFCVGAGAALCGLARGTGSGPGSESSDLAAESIGEALSARLGLGGAVAVGGDAELGGLAEHTRGVAAGYDDVLYLHADVSVGAGIIVGGRPLVPGSARGVSGRGAEVGHLVVNPGGRACGCGARGCWETEIGERGLLLSAGRDGVGRQEVRTVVDAAARGDSAAQAGLRRAGDWLGFGVANLVTLVNPQMVVFGGMLRDVYLAAAAQVRTRLRRMGLPAARERVRLRTPELGEDAPLVGAAELAFARLLADPLDVAGTGHPSRAVLYKADP